MFESVISIEKVLVRVKKRKLGNLSIYFFLGFYYKVCFLDVLYEEFFLKWYISRSKYVFGGSDVVGIFVRYRMERKDS